MMPNLYTLESRNVRRTWLLMAVFLAAVIGLGYYLSYVLDNPVILYAAVGISLSMNLLAYWRSDKIALAISGAKPASRGEHRELFNIIENLSITAGLPMPKVYVIEDSAPNAFATGRDKEHAVVAVTTGLLSLLDRTELEGVIAHELSHIGNRDMLVGTVAVVLVGFVAILSDFFLRSMMFGGGNRDNRAGGILLLIGIVFAVLSPIIAQLIQLAVSRKREFLADASGALLTRYPEGLASALEKIGGHAQPLRRASTATAHLFLADPFAGSGKRVMKLFMTHPPVEERVRALRGR